MSSTGEARWYSPITLCLTGLYLVGYLILTLACGLTLFVWAALYMESKLEALSRLLLKGTRSEKKVPKWLTRWANGD